MIETSTAYKDAVASHRHHWTGRATIDYTDYNLDASIATSVEESDRLSDDAQLTDGILVTTWDYFASWDRFEWGQHFRSEESTNNEKGALSYQVSDGDGDFHNYGGFVSGYTCFNKYEPLNDDDLIAWYSFNDGDADDDSGNGNDATVTGASTTTGVSGLGLSFDGVDDEVDAGAIQDLFADSSEAWSIAFWADVDDGTIFDNGNLVIERLSDVSYNVELRGADNDIYSQETGWINWAVTWDGSDARVSINGEQLSNQTASVLIDPTGEEITDDGGGEIDPGLDVWRAS